MPLSPSLEGRRREKALPTLFSHMMDGGDLDKASERGEKRKEKGQAARERKRQEYYCDQNVKRSTIMFIFKTHF